MAPSYGRSTASTFGKKASDFFDNTAVLCCALMRLRQANAFVSVPVLAEVFLPDAGGA